MIAFSDMPDCRANEHRNAANALANVSLGGMGLAEYQQAWTYPRNKRVQLCAGREVNDPEPFSRESSRLEGKLFEISDQVDYA